MKAPHSIEYDESGEPVSAVDWLGRRFSVGDTVMYCIGAGRGQMLAFGEVKKLRLKTVFDWNQARQRIEQDSVEVQVLTTKTSGHWNNEKRTRPAWVNEMNISALPIV